MPLNASFLMFMRRPMWRVSIGWYEVSICKAVDSCPCDSSGQARWSATADEQVLRTLKSDDSAMRMLRQIIYEHAAVGLRLTDDQVITQVTGMLSSGELRLCRGADAANPVGRAATRGHQLAECIRAVETAIASLSHWGRGLRIAPPDAWPRLRGYATLEIVPTREARQILDRLAAEGIHDPARKAALGEAAQLLSEVEERPLEGALVMLREVRLRSAPAEPRVTPSQSLKGLRTVELHWIEIELVGEDGSPIRNEEYLIVTSDLQKHIGMTDGKGRARLERIPAGECKVSFPRLDQDAWRFA